MERYLRVNLLGPGPRLMKKYFTGPRSHKDRETLLYSVHTGSGAHLAFCPVGTDSFFPQE